METYISVILTLLTIVTGILTVVTFVNGRKKDSKDEGRSDGAMAQKLDDIDERTKSIQQDVRELRESDRATAMLAAKAEQKAQYAHERINRIDRARSVALRKDAQ